MSSAATANQEEKMSKPAPKLHKEEEPFIPYVELEDFDSILQERSQSYSKRMGISSQL